MKYQTSASADASETKEYMGWGYRNFHRGYQKYDSVFFSAGLFCIGIKRVEVQYLRQDVGGAVNIN